MRFVGMLIQRLFYSLKTKSVLKTAQLLLPQVFLLSFPLFLSNSPSTNPRGMSFTGNFFLSAGTPKHAYFCCCVHSYFAPMSTIPATQEDLWSHKACLMTCLSQNLQRKLHPATHLHFLCCYCLAGCLSLC